jgi:cyclopropane-fatty-acyl-phospholipid synthase
LIIDYGYLEKKMRNTLQAVSCHKYSNVLKNIGRTDITYNLSFNLFKEIANQQGGLNNKLTTQGKFLTKIGIEKRAEMISKNQNFLKKADIYYRLKRLIDNNQMGNLFKVMLIKNTKNNFKLGF